MKKLVGLLTTLAITGWAGAASAATADITSLHGFGAIGPSGSCETDSVSGAVLGAGAELTKANHVSGTCFGSVGVDIDPLTNTFSIFATESGPDGTIGANYQWIQVLISNMNGLGSITGVNLISQDLFSFGNLNPAASISFGADWVTVLWDPDFFGQVSIKDGGIATFAFTTDLAVPEPGTLALLGLGLAGLGLSRRRKAA